ncbi:MAG: hypothetical protein J6J71_04560 [Prevotella sp.]|nr:hypothetical protein [Prevotella sp.]
MEKRYRVKGVAEKAFILRGMYFRFGGTIETVILESELAFVKERCKLEKVEDMKAKTAPSQPIPNNSPNTPKGVKNELPKTTSGTNKGANKAKV